MLFGWWILLLGAGLGPTLRSETLTIATYNIENYGPANRVTAAGYRKDYPKPEAEKAALRRVIVGLGADVLVLQEMGSQRHLDELRRDLKAQGCDYPYAVLAEASDADRHVALLAKRPLRGVTTLAGLEFPYFGGRERVKRGLLLVTVATEAGDVTLFAFHLKSRFTDRPDDPESAIRRTGEAAAVRDAILRKFPNPAVARFVVLGDCNDSKASKPLERLQHRGDTIAAVLLPATDDHGETWTYSYRREDSYSHVDHILVSPALRGAVIDGSAHIYSGDGVSEASDHRPVVVRLTLEAKN
jgi:endonuclease/exonuclease/phosphatase family metal-dependent hydrolase